MKVFVTVNGEKRTAMAPSGVAFAVVSGSCPCCGAKVFKVSGHDAVSVCCAKSVGTMAAEGA